MEKVDELLARMTLDEKLGQLNLVTAGQAVTGPVGSGDMTENLRAGRIGGVLNLWGRESLRAAQRLAVEESRLGVPLFFGLDSFGEFRPENEGPGPRDFRTKRYVLMGESEIQGNRAGPRPQNAEVNGKPFQAVCH